MPQPLTQSESYVQVKLNRLIVDVVQVNVIIYRYMDSIWPLFTRSYCFRHKPPFSHVCIAVLN